MGDDPLAELLSSPLDEKTPGPGRRWWLGLGAALLAAALAGTGVALWLTRDSGGGATTTAAAGTSGTTAAPGESSTITTEAPGGATTTTAAPVAGTPESRVYAQLVATDAGIFLFGGLQPVQRLNGGRFDDVWRYDPTAGEWWELQPAGGPAPRAGAAVAYDAGSGLVVLFGGAVGSCSYPACRDHLEDTWVYDPAANTWEERAPAVAPPARHGHTMAYDAQSDRVVLFGGDTGTQWLADTWAYDTDADAWTEITTEEAPWPVAQQAMAYDPAADRIVLWGGADREESIVWTFDLEAAAWSAAAWEPAPEPAWDACLVWDAAAEQLLLIGGEGPTTVQISEVITARQVMWRDEVWTLDLEAGAWTLLGRLPGPVSQHGCADDPGGTGVFIWNYGALLPVDPATGAGMAEG